MEWQKGRTMQKIILPKKYYDGQQIREVVMDVFDDYDTIMKVLTKFAELPSAIVYCRDCKHQEKFFHEDKRRKEGGYYIFGCELADGYSHVCLDEDFCSQAERKDT